MFYQWKKKRRKKVDLLVSSSRAVMYLLAHLSPSCCLSAAITPRFHQTALDPASVPGLQASPRDNYGTGRSPHANPSGHWAAEGPTAARNQEVSTRPLNHAPYTENRVLTPSRFRQPSQPRSSHGSPQREFATQTGKCCSGCCWCSVCVVVVEVVVVVLVLWMVVV